MFMELQSLTWRYDYSETQNFYLLTVYFIQFQRDPLLEKWQHDLIVAAGRKLDHAHMVRFEERTGVLV